MSKLQVRLSQILQRLTTERLGAKDFLGSAKSGHTAVGSILKVESSLSLFLDQKIYCYEDAYFEIKI